MPTIATINGFRLYFYSNEHNPVHVHIQYAEKSIRIELGTWKVSQNKGFKPHQVTKAIELAKKYESEIREAWNG